MTNVSDMAREFNRKFRLAKERAEARLRELEENDAKLRRNN